MTLQSSEGSSRNKSRAGGAREYQTVSHVGTREKSRDTASPSAGERKIVKLGQQINGMATV